MGHLKNKSEINLTAAELLHKNNLYPSVVHCAYYSCVQLMRHIWTNKMGKTFDELSVLTKNSKEGSHELLINKVKTFLRSESLDDRAFNNSILQLKKLRVKADYEDEQIDSTISHNSISLSNATIKILNKTL
jgi:uncharacterized protein (UPF0332 family)